MQEIKISMKIPTLKIDLGQEEILPPSARFE